MTISKEGIYLNWFRHDMDCRERWQRRGEPWNTKCVVVFKDKSEVTIDLGIKEERPHWKWEDVSAFFFNTANGKWKGSCVMPCAFNAEKRVELISFGDTRSVCRKELAKRYLKHKAFIEEMKDPAKKLAVMLKNHDWFHYYSDDSKRRGELQAHRGVCPDSGPRDGPQTKGRKTPIGVKGTVFWTGANRWKPDCRRVGIKGEDGNTYWTAGSNVERIDN